jgi:hypothetical protein
MTANKRLGNKWTVNEVISLQREYELLEWTVNQIAEKHQRSDSSILYKLESEGFINSWNEARGFNSEKYQNSLSDVAKNDVKNDVKNVVKNVVNNVVKDEDEDEDEDEEFGGGDDNDEEYQFVEEVESDDEESEYDESEVEQLSERVWSLETSVSEISSMVKSIYSILSAKQSNNSSKRKPLRSASASAV